MNFFLQNRTATIIIVVLIALNLFSIYFFVIHKRISHRRHFPKDRSAWQDRRQEKRMPSGKAHFMEKELGFDEEQSKKFQKFRKSHFEKSIKKRKEMRDLREYMFDNLSNESFNVDSTTAIISQSQLEIEIDMFEHFKSVRDICSEEQKIKFDKMIKRITKKMGEREFLPNKERSNKK